jgi:hypothetical protein
MLLERMSGGELLEELMSKPTEFPPPDVSTSSVETAVLPSIAHCVRYMPYSCSAATVLGL